MHQLASGSLIFTIVCNVAHSDVPSPKLAQNAHSYGLNGPQLTREAVEAQRAFSA